jgi:hypothetical protein
MCVAGAHCFWFLACVNCGTICVSFREPPRKGLISSRYRHARVLHGPTGGPQCVPDALDVIADALLGFRDAKARGVRRKVF